jgi:hypothetical protein
MTSTSTGTGAGSIVAGLLVAVAAVTPIIWFANSDPAAPANEEAAVVTAAPDLTVAPVTETVEIVVEPGRVEIDALPESIVRALEAVGNVREEGAAELGLPPSVVKVLADRDVVLQVAEEGAP